MVDPKLLGVSSTKLSPDEYYKATGKLKDKKIKCATLKSPELDNYFKKCAELGWSMKAAVETLVERNGYSTNNLKLDNDPYIMLASCLGDN